MERRLAAVLAADVVGYSRLMAADERGTHARLKALRQDFIEPKVAEHRGRTVKLMGDGALVEFASVVDAVECAAALQPGVAERQAGLPEEQRIAFRIGINLGDILIEDDDIYGDGVNVAARLEALAPPGGICVSRTVYNHVRNKVDLGFEPMGEHRVKNIPEPVVVYRVVADRVVVTEAIGQRRPGMASWRRAAIAALLGLIVAGGAVWHWSVQRPAGPDGAAGASVLDTRRIAVLPFVNISADADNDYFSDGLTEELITQLSKIGDLSVIARTSAMKYKDTDKSVAEIGADLGVGTILEGSVRKVGDEVRITTQLIDVASEAHLWAENYDRQLAAIFAIQSSIAEEVAHVLKIKLLEPEKARIKTPGTSNAEAYNLYLKALFLYEQGSTENFLASLEVLKQAVDLDPQFAAAYAALADFSNSLRWFTDTPAAEAHRQAKVYAEKAIALDDSVARAYVALADARMGGDFDWEGAGAAFRRAIELEPSLARAHQHYGHYYLGVLTRQVDEALAEVDRAVQLNPLSLSSLISRAWVHYHRSEYAEAIKWFREGAQLAPDDHWVHVGIGQCLVYQEKYEEGLAELDKAVELTPDFAQLVAYQAWGYGKAGRLDDARRLVAQVAQMAAEQPVSPMAFAWAYTGMGEKGTAIDWLEKAYEARDGAVIFVRVPEFYDVLSSEPRYHALLAKMGLAA